VHITGLLNVRYTGIVPHWHKHCNSHITYRGGSSPKILEGALPPSTHSSPSPFSLSSETGKKYEIHTGPHLKSIITRFANSVICNPETHRNEGWRAETGLGFLTEGQRAPSPFSFYRCKFVSINSVQFRDLGERCKLPSPWKFGLWSILGPQKWRPNSQLDFESRGQVPPSGGVPPCQNVEPPLIT